MKYPTANFSNLLHDNNTAIAAVSGGLDSMVLCALLIQNKIKFQIAHVNFGLRGNESDGDEKFIREFAERNALTMHLLKVDAHKESEAAQQSIQEYARKVRYDLFEKIRLEADAKYIVTAHHKNDQAETIVHQFIRGGGLAALRGMKLLQGNILRPLLAMSREEIAAYAKANKVEWREDSTNQKTDYMRNFIRHDVMPILEKINVDVVNTLATRAELFGEMELLVESALQAEIATELQRENGTVKFSVHWVAQHQAPKTLLWYLLKPYGFHSTQTAEAHGLCDAATGAQLLSKSHVLLRDREHFLITRRDALPEILLSIPQAPFEIHSPVHLKGELVSAPFTLTADSHEAILDFTKLTWPLTLRIWQQGDSFIPLGMSGKQKLSDFLINQKVALTEKHKVLVVESAGKIAWVVGYRISNEFKIEPTTEQALRLSC